MLTVGNKYTLTHKDGQTIVATVVARYIENYEWTLSLRIGEGAVSQYVTWQQKCVTAYKA